MLTGRKRVVVPLGAGRQAEQRVAGGVAVGIRRRTGHLRLVTEFALQLLARQLEHLLCVRSRTGFNGRRSVPQGYLACQLKHLLCVRSRTGFYKRRIAPQGVLGPPAYGRLIKTQVNATQRVPMAAAFSPQAQILADGENRQQEAYRKLA